MREIPYRYVCLCAGIVAAITSMAVVGTASAAPNGGPNGGPNGLSYKWDLGTGADVSTSAAAHFTDASRVGDAGQIDGTNCRELKPNVFQSGWVMPAFDTDPDLYGAAKHSFFLTIHFKDVASSPLTVYANKGGAGFYGGGWVGLVGGSGSGEWKDATVVLPRSMMRSQDGVHFQFTFANIKAAVPIASMTLFSEACTDIPDVKEKIAAAEKADAERRAARVDARKAKFTFVPLSPAGEAPPVTPEETAAGYRVFFPAQARALYGNSEPAPDELIAAPTWFSALDQTQSITVAIRALKDVGKVTVKLGTFAGAASQQSPLTLDDTAVRWAQYREYRVGSSWSTSYQVKPSILLEKDADVVTPDQLGIVSILIHVPAHAAAGTYKGSLEFTAEQGQPRTFPVSLTVYPYKLQHPAYATHSPFYYVDYANFDPLELMDMRSHGVDGLVTGMAPPPGAAGSPDVVDASRKISDGYALLTKLGFLSPMICNVGNLSRYMGKDTPANEAGFVTTIRLAKQLADSAGFREAAFFPVDEPQNPKLVARATLACRWIKTIPGAATYITSNPTAVAKMERVLDDVSYNLAYMNAKTVARVHQVHETLMYYAGCCDVEPENERFRAGFYLNKTQAVGAQYFAYYECADDPLNDLDGGNRDWSGVFPSMTSPFPDTTLGWESFREGVSDYQYAYTLQQAAKRAQQQGRDVVAKKAMKVYEDVMNAVNIDASKYSGPELAIEADVSKKNEQVDPAQLLKQNQIAAGWFDQSRQKIAQAIADCTVPPRRASGD